MRKSNISVHDILFRTAGVLFVLTLFSVYMLCGMYAKYTTSGSYGDSARVASFGTIVIMEHKEVLDESLTNGMMYRLTEDEVEQNTNIIALAGVDIPKDPFIRLTNIGEVKCELYLQVTKSENFPSEITVDIDSNYWVSVAGKSDVYKYKYPIGPGSENIDEIYILENNRLEVSPKYDYNPNGDVSLTFSAWLQQANE